MPIVTTHKNRNLESERINMGRKIYQMRDTEKKMGLVSFF